METQPAMRKQTTGQAVGATAAIGRSPSVQGYAIALVAAVILSTTAIFIRYLTQTYHMPALVLACWRDAFVAATMVLVLGLFRPGLLQVPRRHLRWLVMYGFMLTLFNAFWTLAVALNGAAVATVLVYSSTAFTALLARWLLREHLGLVKVLAVTMSLAGCALVSGALVPGAWHTDVMGIVTGVLSGLWYAGYSLMGRSASQRGINPWTTLTYTFAFAAMLLLALNLGLGKLLPGASVRPEDLLWLGRATRGWLVLFVLAAGPTVLGFGLYNVSLGHLPSSTANLIVSLEPAFTAVIAYIVLDERLSGPQIGGSILILTGVLLLRLFEGRAPASAPQQ
ncbi:MAG: DMT family transporter [Candidatus Cryosericum sp.]